MRDGDNEVLIAEIFSPDVPEGLFRGTMRWPLILQPSWGSMQ